jgi:hypothetical protein
MQNAARKQSEAQMNSGRLARDAAEDSTLASTRDVSIRLDLAERRVDLLSFLA